MASTVQAGESAQRVSFRNAAFISYSHAADGKLAPALQRALHDFAKPWYQLRALRVFRDKTSLAANPALWKAIESALGDSVWFLYMASPMAAQSHWVQQEIQWWLENRSSDKVLILLTDGELTWDSLAGDFDWSRTTSVPESLRGQFTEEPLYVDLRWARSAENLSLRHSQFRAAILDIAAPLRGKPKEDLDGEDVRQHRRNRVWAWSASVALAVLAATAITFAFYASSQRTEALRQRDEAIGRLYSQQLARVGDLTSTDPGLARDVLDATIRSAGELREFTWNLYARLSTPTVFAIGGARNYRSNDESSPVFAISHDGRRLATASQRRVRKSPNSSQDATIGEILLWDTETGALVATLPLTEPGRAADLRIASIAFSPDDRELAASAGDSPGVTKVWEVGTGRELMVVENNFPLFVLLTNVGGDSGTETPATRRLISVNQYASSVWDGIGAHVTRRTLETPAIGAVALSPNGRYVFTAGRTGIDRWDVATGSRTSVPNPAGVQFLVALSTNGERIARAIGTSIDVWRSGHDSVEWRLERGHRETVTAIAFSADGSTLASGGTDGTVRLWDLERGVATLTLRGPQAAVSALEFSRDGRRLAAGGADATVFLWDVVRPTVRPTERIETNILSSCVGFSLEGASLVVDSGGTLTVRHPSDALPPTATTIGGVVRSCGISRNGKVMFAVDSGAHLVLIDARTGDIRGRTSPVTNPESVRLSVDGDVVAAYVGPAAFAVWDAMTSKRRAKIDVDGTLEGPFELMRDGLVVAQFRNDRGSWVGVWDTRVARRLSLTPMPAWRYHAQSAVCLPERLLASTDGGDLRIVDLGGGTLKRHLAWRIGDSFMSSNEATVIAFSPDCSVLAVGDLFGQISLWEIASGANRYRVAAHSGLQVVQWRDGRGFGTRTSHNADGVAALDFSPDGRTLASGGGTSAGRGELRLWDAARGSLLATLPAEGGAVKRVMFSASGYQLGVLQQRSRQDVRNEATLLEVWNAQGAERALLSADTAAITRLTFSPDGSRLISEGTTTKSWNLAQNRLERVSPLSPSRENNDARRGPRARTLRGEEVFASEEVLFVDRGAGAPIFRVDSADEAYSFHAEPIEALHMMSDGRLASQGGYGNVKERPAEIILWDLTFGRAITHAFEPSNVVTSFVFSPDERTFVTAGALGPAAGHAGFVHIWDAQRLTLIAALRDHAALVTAVAFSSDGKMLATGDANGFVRIWDLTLVRRRRAA